MKKTVVVIDGMGGGIGVQLIQGLRSELGAEVELIALGTNSTATERMVRSGADRGASGENAIRVSVGLGDYILGPIGIVLPDGLMGEVSPDIARAILSAPGERILIPVAQQHFILAGTELRPLSQAIAQAVALVVSRLAERHT